MTPEATSLIAAAQRELQNNKVENAASLLDQATRCASSDVDLLQMAGVIHSLAGNHERAVDLLRRVARKLPSLPQAHANLARALWRAGQPARALRCHSRLDELGVDDVQTLLDRVTLLAEIGRFEQALELAERATNIAPDNPNTWSARGNALHELKRHAEALDCFDRALALDDRLVSGWANKGLTLHAMRRLREADEHLQRALALDPGNAITWSNRGATKLGLQDYGQALDCLDKALALWPAQAIPAKTRRQHVRQLPHPQRKYLSMLFARAEALTMLKRHPEAMAAYADLLEYSTGIDLSLGMALYAFRFCGNWDQDAKLVAEFERAARAGKPPQQPFVAAMVLDDPALQYRIAKGFMRRYDHTCEPFWKGERYKHDRLRLAYFSNNFRSHPNAYLTAGLFANHDRSRIELTAVDVSNGPPDDMTMRIKTSFDHYLEAGSIDDESLARMLREREIDILVDLMGPTSGARPGVFLWRPAPIQVCWLGFPGTSGNRSIDYLLADRIVIPLRERKYYAEKVVYLDDCYQCTDNTREISSEPMSREMFGLPANGFVFCCFNHTGKIAPSTFTLWMRVLAEVPESVLWLLQDFPLQAENLRYAAAVHGIDPKRLVFADRLPQAQHLARHQLADLSLDTLPYNAHTTASDALWAGLPVLTCTGNTFAGRVATSVLFAAGLPELVCSSRDEYQRKAVALATTDRPHLEALRRRLQANRLNLPLFDTARFARRLEKTLFRLAALNDRSRA